MRYTSSSICSFLFSVCVVAFVGCGPRGESRTLEQIFTDARSAYSSAASKVNADVKEPVAQLSGNLERLAGLGGGGDAREVSKQVAEGLASLASRAGYTQRPSMTELVNQYRAVTANSDKPTTLGDPSLKLLVARTYQILASEISTTNFKL